MATLKDWEQWGYEMEMGIRRWYHPTEDLPRHNTPENIEAWNRGVSRAQKETNGKPFRKVTASEHRKNAPMFSGLLAYFPDALEEVARLSKAGNDKHNPGEPLHWSRGKSNDHKDCIVRHLKDAGTIDEEDGFLHDTKVAWRALANLQLALEKEKE